MGLQGCVVQHGEYNQYFFNNYKCSISLQNRIKENKSEIKTFSDKTYCHQNVIQELLKKKCSILGWKEIILEGFQEGMKRARNTKIFINVKDCVFLLSLKYTYGLKQHYNIILQRIL